MSVWIRRTLLFLVVMTATFLLASVCAPKGRVFKDEMAIYAGNSKVFRALQNAKLWENWDPWYSRDSMQKRKFIGEVGRAGSGFSWMGKTEGKIDIVSVAKPDSIFCRYVIGKGLVKTQGTLSFVLQQKGNATRVLWTNTTTYPFLQRLKNYFNPSYLSEEINIGLTQLKKYVESGTESIGVEVGNGVSITSVHGVNYAVIRKRNVAEADMNLFAISASKEVYSYIQTNGLSAKGPPCLLRYNFDDNSGFYNVAAGVPISDLLEEEMKSVGIGSDSALLGSSIMVKTNKGSGEFPEEMFLYLSENSKSVELPIVQYFIVGPMHTDRESNYKIKWKVTFSD